MGSRVSFFLLYFAVVSAAMTACDAAGEWEEALSLFEEMQMAGTPMDAVTYCAAMNACGTGGQWERALSLLNEMTSVGLRPNVVCYTAGGKGQSCKIALILCRINSVILERKTPGG